MAKKKTLKFGYFDEMSLRSGVVKETDRTPEVRYSYRALSVEDVAKWDTAIILAASDANALTEATLEAISKAIENWDLRKPDRKDKANSKGVLVDPNDVEELKRVAEYIIEQIAIELRYIPILTEKKAKNL